MHTKVLGATPERLKYFKVKYTSNALHALTGALFLLRPNFIIRCTRHAISQEAFESQVGSTIFNDGNTYSHRLLLPGMLYTVAPPGGSVGNLETFRREFESRCSHTNWDFSTQKNEKDRLAIARRSLKDSSVTIFSLTCMLMSCVVGVCPGCISVVLNTVRESATPDSKENKQTQADAGSRLFSKAFSVRRVVA